jgi:group I intron endonuclease
MGIIYILTSPSGKSYIGQTIQSLDKRWKQHIDASRREYKDNCKVLNKSIRKYGHIHFTHSVLEECDNELLNTKEVEYIEKYNTMVPYGMNIKQGDGADSSSEVSKQKISESCKGRVVSEETKLLMSKSRKTSELPMYLIKNTRGYRVCNHPMGPEKRFFAKSKTDDEKYEKALAYLNKLNSLSEPEPVVEKPVREKYLQFHKNGYCVKFPETKVKYFVSKNIPKEELYTNALNYLNELKSAVQRLNVSGGESP